MVDITAGRYVAPDLTGADKRRVIVGSSLGTVFEWYDFYIFGTLTPILAPKFIGAAGVPPTAAFILTLCVFAAGFAVRPFGALVFGRLGDIVGRKNTFLVTMTLMGLGTFLIGVLPTYAQWGLFAPIALVLLRLVQGLALGGEYGGAATYVAEHSPHEKRALYTSWIQTTATLGLFMALLVMLGIQYIFGLLQDGDNAAGLATFVAGEAPYKDWGWRIPFLLSALLLGISIWIRLKLNESPMFQQMKDEGRHCKAPLSEAFGQWKNARIAILALLGATSGEAVIWYGGQFYALFFLTQTLKVTPAYAQLMIAAALLLGTPFFIVFGWLSDRIGRKPVMMAGFLLGAITYFPLFQGLTYFANPDLYAALSASPVTVVADPADCSLQLKLTGTEKFTSSCDMATSTLVSKSVNYDLVDGPAGSVAQIKMGNTVIDSFAASGLSGDEVKAKTDAFGKAVGDAITANGYPAKADPAKTNYVMTIILLTILVIYVTLVYAPIAAFLVELFPTRIRYTGMSLPYHIGNGWFGGFLPPIVFAIVASTGNIYSGLWYPIAIAAMSFVVALFFLPETKDRDIGTWHWDH